LRYGRRAGGQGGEHRGNSRTRSCWRLCGWCRRRGGGGRHRDRGGRWPRRCRGWLGAFRGNVVRRRGLRRTIRSRCRGRLRLGAGYMDSCRLTIPYGAGRRQQFRDLSMRLLRLLGQRLTLIDNHDVRRFQGCSAGTRNVGGRFIADGHVVCTQTTTQRRDATSGVRHGRPKKLAALAALGRASPRCLFQEVFLTTHAGEQDTLHDIPRSDGFWKRKPFPHVPGRSRHDLWCPQRRLGCQPHRDVHSRCLSIAFFTSVRVSLIR
jgi:hypothetical protein